MGLNCCFCGRHVITTLDQDLVMVASWKLPSAKPLGDWVAHKECLINRLREESVPMEKAEA